MAHDCHLGVGLGAGLMPVCLGGDRELPRATSEVGAAVFLHPCIVWRDTVKANCSRSSSQLSGTRWWLMWAAGDVSLGGVLC